jgi:hypothetical protein
MATCVNHYRLLQALRLACLVGAIFFLLNYFLYLSEIVIFPFDWEPTDGDHLNFAHRIAGNLPIFLSIDQGQALSIYNPLYHSIVGFLGGEHSSLAFARSLAALFWFLVPISVFLFYKKTWGVVFALAAALLVAMPPEPDMLIDIVHVTPSSTLAILFLWSLLYSEKCIAQVNAGWFRWFVLGGLISLTFLAKQQGLIAAMVIGCFLFARQISLTNWLFVNLGGLAIVIPFITYFELANYGNYLNAVLFDVRDIMITSSQLSLKRLWDFLFVSNYLFTVVIFMSFVSLFAVRGYRKDVSIWQISFLLHIPFLLALLGNGGGGPNYFITFWITIVLLAVETARKSEEAPAVNFGIASAILFSTIVLVTGILSDRLDADNYIYNILTMFFGLLLLTVMVFRNLSSSESSALLLKKNKNYGLYLSSALVFSLFVNVFSGAIPTFRDLSNLKSSVSAARELMSTHFFNVGALVVEKKPTSVLTNRNIGALVAAKVPVDNEGATMFSYGWLSERFDKSIVLDKIRKREYDLISTGIQNYPVDVTKEIKANYILLLSSEANLYLGSRGIVEIYGPKISGVNQ